MFHRKNTTGRPYLYRVVFEVLGRSVEMGVTYEEIDRLKRKGAELLAIRGKVTSYVTQLQHTIGNTLGNAVGGASSRSKPKAKTAPATAATTSAVN
jgi:hypothetical protein